MALSPKLIKRFYEPLVLLRVLSQVQGNKIRNQAWATGALEDTPGFEMRRKVMHALCDMCDYLKGGDTVTAMAMEDLPNGPQYWITTNDRPQKIRDFLHEILRMLESRALSTSADCLTFKASLFEKFVNLQRTRLKFYQKQLKTNIGQELKRVELSSETSINQHGKNV
jgi:hypothetical protein